ncbi:MAG TPA: hypothetical protein VE915_03670 [Actinomycetota bacterium]|nr:hypothetical protein [Actinomycetota bacterium]
MSRRRAVLAAAAGPILIVGATLVVLHDFAFMGRMSAQHVDPLAFWLPTHCFLGENLSSGHIPTWNPHVMGGLPFAADPQSGWMYLPAMILYTVLPCGSAIRWFIILQPLLAGLGTYWFLRTEGLSRPAGTVGGLMLALGIASSRLALTLPFAGLLAWTPILLGCASRLLQARTWPARIAWAGLASAAWGQVAAAHMSHGLVIATGALAFYGIAKSRSEIRGGRSGRELLAVAALLVAAMPLVNLAFFLPRFAYLPRTTLALGYDGLEALGDRLAGRPLSQAQLGAAVSPPWPLAFATSPGAYLGTTMLALSFGAWRLAPRRLPVVAFGAFAVLCYVLSLRAVASFVDGNLSWVPLSDVYLHEPARLRYGVILALPLLAAAGLDGWREAPRHRAGVLLSGLMVWGLLPLLAGADPIRLALPAVGVAASVAALAAAPTRPAFFVLVPALLAVELSANGLIGQTFSDGEVPSRVHPPILNVPFTPLAQPRFSASDYLARGPIALRLKAEDDRFISLDPSRVTDRGYLEHQGPASWGLLANQRAMLFGLEDAQGYNPVQPLAYWKFVRSVEPKQIKYNAAVFLESSAVALGLLDVAWIVGPADDPPVPEAIAVATDGLWSLYHVAIETPRASVLTRWTVAPDDDAARAAVTAPEFEPSVQVVLEKDPGLSPNGEGTTEASYERIGPDRARVAVDAPGAGMLLVRNTYDPNWRARLDGQPVPILRADSFLQAVALPAGPHVIELEHDDPWVGRGLLGSGLAIGGLALAGVFLRRGRRGVPPPQRKDQKGGSDHRGDTGDRPGELPGEGAAEHGQDQQTRRDVHGQRQDRHQTHGRSHTHHSEPPCRQETGQE